MAAALLGLFAVAHGDSAIHADGAVPMLPMCMGY